MHPGGITHAHPNATDTPPSTTYNFSIDYAAAAAACTAVRRPPAATCQPLAPHPYPPPPPRNRQTPPSPPRRPQPPLPAALTRSSAATGAPAGAAPQSELLPHARAALQPAPQAARAPRPPPLRHTPLSYLLLLDGFGWVRWLWMGSGRCAGRITATQVNCRGRALTWRSRPPAPLREIRWISRWSCGAPPVGRPPQLQLRSCSRGRPDADVDGDRSAGRARAAAEARAPHHRLR
eukprot:scaffold19191_cov134-Isochrysis_galbana.AAC.13